VLVFDIETGGMEWGEIEQYWRPEDVAVGNLKDPEKIAAKVEEARQAFIERAALSPVTGRVLAIGYMREAGKCRIDGSPEPEMLGRFWVIVGKMMESRVPIVGHCIHTFDLPFLIRRSWFLGVKVPDGLMVNGKYWHHLFVDLHQKWKLGIYGSEVMDAKLDTLARFFGVGGKPDGVTGADFARLWAGGKEDREKAEEYLRNDLAMTWGVANRMGVQ